MDGGGLVGEKFVGQRPEIVTFGSHIGEIGQDERSIGVDQDRTLVAEDNRVSAIEIGLVDKVRSQLVEVEESDKNREDLAIVIEQRGGIGYGIARAKGRGSGLAPDSGGETKRVGEPIGIGIIGEREGIGGRGKRVAERANAIERTLYRRAVGSEGNSDGRELIVKKQKIVADVGEIGRRAGTGRELVRGNGLDILDGRDRLIDIGQQRLKSTAGCKLQSIHDNVTRENNNTEDAAEDKDSHGEDNLLGQCIG